MQQNVNQMDQTWQWKTYEAHPCSIHARTMGMRVYVNARTFYNQKTQIAKWKALPQKWCDFWYENLWHEIPIKINQYVIISRNYSQFNGWAHVSFILLLMHSVHWNDCAAYK